MNKNIENEEIENSNLVYELLYDNFNVVVMKNREEIDKYHLGVHEVHSLGHYKLE